MSATPNSLPCKEEKANMLVVEGKDDCNGIYQLARKCGLNPSFGIWEGGNDVGALERFGGLLLSSRKRPEILGIVLDCDQNDIGDGGGAGRRWTQIQDRLRGAPYVVPSAPASAGTIIDGTQGYPRIGVWLMPDNRAAGMFEDFLLHLVPPAAMDFARNAARGAKALGYGCFKEVHESKAVAHTYLAWQDEPGKPIGLAIRSGFFDLESPKAVAFIGWLRELFRIPPDEGSGQVPA